MLANKTECVWTESQAKGEQRPVKVMVSLPLLSFASHMYERKGGREKKEASKKSLPGKFIML